MANWLLKTEPGTYSWDDLVREKQAVWDGISNPTALIHLRAMKANDRVLVYHSGDAKTCVGIAKITKGPYADPKLDNPKLVVVEIKPVKPLKSPVTLAQIKADKSFAGWDLLRITRLSVVPVAQNIWERIEALAGK